MKKIVLFTLLLLGFAPAFAAISPEEIVRKLDQNFSRIRDAKAEITLDSGLQLLGCGGLQQQKGLLFFKAPDKIKIMLNHDTYFIRGNRIRKIDGEGKRYYVKLLHAPDFSPGFGPRLITHNFNLKIIKESTDEVIIEGLPKPGVLKNVKKVFFRIDPKEYILRGMDLSMRQNISGRIYIKYEKIDGMAVPTVTWGKSALELASETLVGLTFNLRGEKIRINTGLSNKLFDPGF